MATILPTEPASARSGMPVTAAKAMIGAPSAPYDTGALLAMAATRIASSAGMPSVIRIGATKAHG